jgi:GxxExxY protein
MNCERPDSVFNKQYAMAVRYDGIIVGEYIADFLVEKLILVELKVVKALDDVHIAQCMNYLRATGKRLCLLMNFARPRVEMKRIAL